MINQKGPEEKKSRGMTVTVIVVLLVVLVICILLLLFRNNGEDTGFVNRRNADSIMDDMSEKVSEGMFECKMTTNWVFDDGGSVSPNAYVANVENNLHSICFDVYEQSTNELLYSSPILPVGTELEDIKLDKELPAGEYPAVVMYTLVDEDNKEVSTVGFDITISVIN